MLDESINVAGKMHRSFVSLRMTNLVIVHIYRTRPPENLGAKS